MERWQVKDIFCRLDDFAPNVTCYDTLVRNLLSAARLAVRWHLAPFVSYPCQGSLPLRLDAIGTRRRVAQTSSMNVEGQDGHMFGWQM